MIYRLSNRQWKELTERGRRLQIAIPSPSEADYWSREDLSLFAGESLAEIEEAWIKRTEQAEIVVGAKLQQLLGQIEEDWSAAVICTRVSVVIVELLCGKERQTIGPIQWPGQAKINGEWVATGISAVAN